MAVAKIGCPIYLVWIVERPGGDEVVKEKGLLSKIP
jgi:hypothetical protein